MQILTKWGFPQNKSAPLDIVYDPNIILRGQDFMNPFLGYPNCPLIGRYNKGQYRIAQTKMHLQFECIYDQKQNVYKCGQSIIKLPQKIQYNLRNIPQVIKHNKPPESKNAKIQDVHPIKFPILNKLKFVFIVTFGQIGRDFLNYLNHMYTLGHQLFLQEKLRRSVYLLPIYAYLPQKSGLIQEEVDKGLNLDNYRSQYLSLHLRFGAPAFSPNNMRLGIEGMKKIVSNPPKKNNKKKQQSKAQNQSSLDNFLKPKKQEQINNNIQKQQKQSGFDWETIQRQIQEEKKQKEIDLKEKIQQKNQQKIDTKPKTNGQNNKNPGIHKGFVHFYTSVLLQQDYRVYYHWHIQKQSRCQVIQTALLCSNSLQEFLFNCQNQLGQKDQCIKEAFNIFSPTF